MASAFVIRVVLCIKTYIHVRTVYMQDKENLLISLGKTPAAHNGSREIGELLEQRVFMHLMCKELPWVVIMMAVLRMGKW